jgi:hypothetical protein
MDLGRPEPGSDVHAHAVGDLDDASHEQGRRREEAEEARGTPEEAAAESRLAEAGERRAAQETWLTWLERGF